MSAKTAFNGKSSAVTIVEMAIVLSIISVLVGVIYISYVFFVKQSKLTKIIVNSTSYTKAMESFHLVYGGLPGDFASASDKLDSSLIDGNGDGYIQTESEQYQFWVHLSAADMLQSSKGKYQTLLPGQTPVIHVNLPSLNNDKLAAGVIYDTPSGVKANSFIVGALNGRNLSTPVLSQDTIKSGDYKFDDGNPLTGGWMCGSNPVGSSTCNYSDSAKNNTNFMLYLPFSRSLLGSTVSCPAQSIAITVSSVNINAFLPEIAGGGTYTGQCRDANQDYKGTYTVSCALQASGLYAATLTTNGCSIKTCTAPSSIANAVTPLSTTAVNVNQIYGFTCNSSLVSNNPMCLAVQGTDNAQFVPTPACVSSSNVGTTGNIPIYSGVSTFTDSGKKFNDSGTTTYDIYTADKVLGLLGKSANIPDKFVPKYQYSSGGSLVKSLIYDDGAATSSNGAVRISDLTVPSTPNAQALLELQSTTRGFMPPKMTSAQKSGITDSLTAVQKTAAKGLMIFDTTLNGMQVWDGASWQSVGSQVVDNMPVGSIVAYYGSTIPDGWLLCNGSTFTQADYPDLYTFLGNSNVLPDLRGLFLRGAGTYGGSDVTSVFGGTIPTAGSVKSKQNHSFASHTHTFAGNALASHTHTFTGTASSHSHSKDGWFTGALPQTCPSGVNCHSYAQGYTAYSINSNTYDVGSTSITPSGTISSVSAGTPSGTNSSEGSTETRPANVAVNYIIKAKPVASAILTVSGTNMAIGTPGTVVKYDSTGLKLVSSSIYEDPSTSNVSIGNSNAPHIAAVLDLSSTTKGFLPPRMTTSQKTALTSTLTTAQQSAAKGLMVFDTTLSQMQVWDGSAWQSMGIAGGGDSIPVGTIVAYYGSTIPDGWLLCNGSTFTQADYPDLYTFLGNSNVLPDLRGLFLRGAGTYGVTTNIGSNKTFEIAPTAGAVRSLQADVFKSHTHTFAGTALGSHTHDFTGTAASHTHTISDSGHVHSDNLIAKNYMWTGYLTWVNWNFQGNLGGSQYYGTPGNSTSATTGITINSTSITPSGTISSVSAGTPSGTNSSEGSTETRPANVAVNYIIKAKTVTSSSSSSSSGGSSAVYFNQGGNSFGQNATLGTNDTYNLIFETNGNEKMRLTTDGKLGINTTSPTEALHVIGAIRIGSGGYSIKNSGPIQLQADDDNTGDGIFSFFAGPDERVRITDGGSVGIGTSSPNTLLDVRGSAYIGQNNGTTSAAIRPSILNISSAGSTVTSSTTGSERVLRMIRGGVSGTKWDSVADISIGTYGTGLSSQTRLDFGLANGNTNNPDTAVMSLLGNGNVGIGTTDPTKQLTLGGTGSVFGVENTAYFSAKNSSGTYEEYFWPRWTDNVMYMNYGVGGFNIRNNASTTTMFMSNDNLVGVGTSSPSSAMHVYGGVSALGGVPATGRGTGYSFNGSGDTDGGMFSPADGTLTFFTNGTERIRINNTGYVGIGTTSPEYPLDIGVTTGVRNFTWVDYWEYAGSIDMGYVGGYATSVSAKILGTLLTTTILLQSDERAKNIKGISDSAEDLQTIMKLEVTDYTKKDFITHGGRLEKKLVAQQVEKHYPQAVSKHTDVVPDIYKPAESYKLNGEKLIIRLAKHGLKKGEKVQLFFESYENKKKIERNKNVYTILSADFNTFTVNPKSKVGKNTKIFVYGREVNDFRTIDYEGIAMLNVSATQEIAKKLEKLEERLGVDSKGNQDEISQELETVEDALELHTLIIYSLIGVIFALLGIIAILIRVLFIRTRKV